MSRTRHHGDRGKKKLFGDNWQWESNEPKWWDKTFHTKPRRAAEKRAIHKVLQGEDAEFPLNHKPQRYYW